MKLVIATHNRKKAGEMASILSRRFPQLEILTLADFPGSSEPEETGSSYRENAEIKARNAVAETALPCIADDAGLEVDFLDGAPGRLSKRFGGEELTFEGKMNRILDSLQGTENRSARFNCCVCLAFPGSENEVHLEFFEADCEGEIARTQSGEGGFGYDPIFYLPERKCTMAQLTPDQKHEISHRGKVLKAAGDWIEANDRAIFGRKPAR